MAKLDHIGDDTASSELYKYLVVNGEKWEFFKELPTLAWFDAVKILEDVDKEKLKTIKKSSVKDQLEFIGVLLKIMDVAVPEQTAKGLADRLSGKVAPVLKIEEAITIGNMLIEDITGAEKKAQAKSGKAKSGATAS